MRFLIQLGTMVCVIFAPEGFAASRSTKGPSSSQDRASTSLVEKYDANDDGKLNADELAAARKEAEQRMLLKLYDKNGDDKLDRKEKKAIQADVQRQYQELLGKYDRNDNGKLDSQEEETARKDARKKLLTQIERANAATSRASASPPQSVSPKRNAAPETKTTGAIPVFTDKGRHGVVADADEFGLSPAFQELTRRYGLTQEGLASAGPLSVSLPGGNLQVEIVLLRYGPSPLTVQIALQYFAGLPGSGDLAPGWAASFLSPDVASWQPASPSQSPAGDFASFIADGGKTVLQKFDSRKQLVEAVYCNAYRIGLERDSKGRILSMKDSAGRTAQFTYSPEGLLTEIRSSQSGNWKFSYDAKKRISRVQGPNNFLADVAYDAEWRVASLRGPTQLALGYGSPADPQAATVTVRRDGAPVKVFAMAKPPARWISIGVENGPRIVYQFDENNRLTELSDSLKRVERFRYGADGKLVEHIQPDGGRTTIEYDSAGHPKKITSPSGLVTGLEYDSHGRLVREKDSGGLDRAYAYDAQGRKVSRTEAGAGAIQYTYSAEGHLIEEARPNLRIRNFYDSLGRWVKSDNGYNRCEFLWSDRGEFKGARWNGRDETQYEHDARGRLTAYVELGRKYQYLWSDDDRLERVVAPSGKATQLKYDATGQLTDVEFPGDLRMRCRKDAAGNLILKDRIATEIQIFPDAAGRPVRFVNGRGQEVQTAFDDMNRPVQITGADQAGGSMSFDKAGRLTRIQAVGFEQALQYDPSDYVVKIADSRFGGAVTHEYDARHRRVATVTPSFGKISYGYDEAGHLQSIADPAGGLFTFSCRPDGQRTSLMYPNKIKVNYSYDPDGRLVKTQLLAPNGQELSSLAYEYDKSGQRIAQRDAKQRGWKISLDADGQIGSVDYGNGQISKVGYDDHGNILQDGEQSWKYDRSNKLIQKGSETFLYDADGNLVEKSGNPPVKYRYDSLNRLVGLEKGPQSVAYQYDPLGRRVAKKAGEKETFYFLDGDAVLFEFGRNKKIQKFFVPGEQLDEVVEVQLADGEKLYPIQDGMRNVRWIADAGGNLLAEIDFGLWGDLAGNVPLLAKMGRGFTGREFDPESGLYYLRARYYDPFLRRFLTIDPDDGDIGMPLTTHPYLYVLNNPAQFMDPYGMWESPFTKIIKAPGRALSAVGSTVKSAYNTVTGTISGVVNGIRDKGVGGYVGDKLSDAGGKFMQGVSDTLSSAGSLAHGNAAEAADASPDKLGEYQQSRPEAVKNAEQGLSDLTGKVSPEASNIYDAVNIASNPNQQEQAQQAGEFYVKNVKDGANSVIGAGGKLTGKGIKEGIGMPESKNLLGQAVDKGIDKGVDKATDFVKITGGPPPPRPPKKPAGNSGGDESPECPPPPKEPADGGAGGETPPSRPPAEKPPPSGPDDADLETAMIFAGIDPDSVKNPAGGYNLSSQQVLVVLITYVVMNHPEMLENPGDGGAEPSGEQAGQSTAQGAAQAAAQNAAQSAAQNAAQNAGRPPGGGGPPPGVGGGCGGPCGR